MITLILITQAASGGFFASWFHDHEGVTWLEACTAAATALVVLTGLGAALFFIFRALV